MADDVRKVQTHLELLRSEYVKLQHQYADLQQQYQLAVSSAPTNSSDTNNFPARLLKFVADLFDKEDYSDLSIKLKDQSLHGHKFVLSARSDCWSDLVEVKQLDLTDFSADVGYALMQWVYTGDTELKQDDYFYLNLLKSARKFELKPLADRCEHALMSSVHVRNCIRFYQTADEIGADNLKQHCSQLISTHWEDFTRADFDSMPAPLTYKMFKAKTQYPLHTAVRMQREDVLFLYLVEHDSQLPGKLNELDNQNALPLDLALKGKCESIATTLVKHGVDVNRVDQDHVCLLHRAVHRGDDFAAKFLINNGADINAISPSTKETALHLVSGYDTKDSPADVFSGMTDVARLLLEKKAKANLKDQDGNTPLHKAVRSHNAPVFQSLLNHGDLDLEVCNGEGHTVFGLALEAGEGDLGQDSFAAKLLKRGSSADAVNKQTGDVLLHKVSRKGLETAALFLVASGATVNHPNVKGETPLHTACLNGLAKLSTALLEKGGNPNAQTNSPIVTDSSAWKQTPLHLAIVSQHKTVIQEFLTFKDFVTKEGSSIQIIPNFTIKDSDDQTVLSLALWQGYHDIAIQLLKGGASVNDMNCDGLTLLHQAILKVDTDSALFVLQQGADCNRKTRDNRSPIQLAIKQGLESVVEHLCLKNATLDQFDENGDCPLWQALESGQEHIATILVRQSCDRDMWGDGPDGCQQTLLHKAIDENNENIACFLIRSGCDLNSPRRPGPSGVGGEEAYDGQTPLHLCCTWGLQSTVQCLLEHGAHVNGQDREGKMPLHVAIENQHSDIITLLLCQPEVNLMAADKKGNTPFSIAMATKNNRAAQAILDREPHCAEQYDTRGRNFLHSAILKGDIESVLFLLSIHVNVNSRTREASQSSPLHLAVTGGNEMIVRNLLEDTRHVPDRFHEGATVPVRNGLGGDSTGCLEFTLWKKHATMNLTVNDCVHFKNVLKAASKDGRNKITTTTKSSFELLAGASINDVTPQKKSALHIAADHDHASITQVLLENGANFDKLDDSLNNALHIACQMGHLSTIRVLLTESRINAEAVNMRGQNPLHVLGQYGKENAAAIFELFMECMPQYPVDKPDINGNTVLLLAYFNGNGSLSRAVVKSGASLGVANKEGVTIFNAPVATKQLLFKLLDMLNREPPWSEGEVCLECGVRFSIKTRKHHCRHCGRLLCSKCSDKDVPIIKYNITKPVRVCETCFDVLSYGALQ